MKLNSACRLSPKTKHSPVLFPCHLLSLIIAYTSISRHASTTVPCHTYLTFFFYGKMTKLSYMSRANITYILLPNLRYFYHKFP
jgi:hypothetical protein